MDDDGVRIDHLEEVLKKHTVRFIYVLPNFHNPVGVTLSLERRIELVKIAAKYGVPIIEDDPYRELRFEGEDLPAMMTLHKENVIYLSTFSKILAPGLRLGWVVGPAGADIEAGAGQAGHRSAHQHLHPDGRPRYDEAWRPGRAFQAR